jgi:hypothetical protein
MRLLGTAGSMAALAAALVALGFASPASATLTEVDATLRLFRADGAPLLWYGVESNASTGTAIASVSGTAGSVHVSLPSGIPLVGGTTLLGGRAFGFVPVGFSNPYVTNTIVFITSPRIGSGTLSGPSAGPLAEARLALMGGIFHLVATPPPYAGGPLTAHSGATGAGIGGTLAHGPVTPPGSTFISILGAPWTVGSAMVQSETVNGAIATFARAGFAHGPLSATTSVSQYGGALQVVTPIQIQSGLPSRNVRSGVFGELTLHFVPEPAPALLLGAGSAALLLLGRARRRRAARRSPRPSR